MAEPRILGERYLLAERLNIEVTGALHALDAEDRGQRWAQLLPRPEHRRRLGDRWFSASARSAGSVAHERVVNVLDHGCEDAHRWLIVDRCPEATLADQLQDRRPVPMLQQPLVDALEGLAELHRHGLCHGGFRPRAVWLIEGRGLLADLRLDPRELGLCTSELPAAPERLRGGARSPEADVFAAGAMLWWVHTGTPPGEVLPRWTGQLPRWAYELCRRCLARDPSRRYPDVPALLEALSAARGTLAEDAPALPGPLPRVSGQAAALESLQGWTRRAEQGSGQVVLLTGPPRSGRSWLTRQATSSGPWQQVTCDLSRPDRGIISLVRRLLGTGRLAGDSLQQHLREQVSRLPPLDDMDLPLLTRMLTERRLPRGWQAVTARLLVAAGIHAHTTVLLQHAERGPSAISQLLLLVAERLCTRHDSRLLLVATWEVPGRRSAHDLVDRLTRWPSGRTLHLHTMAHADRVSYCVRVLGTDPAAAEWLAQQGGDSDTLASAFARATGQGRLISSASGWRVLDPTTPLEAPPPPGEWLEALVSSTPLPVQPILVSIAALGGSPSIQEVEGLWRGLGPSGERTWQQWVATADLLLEAGVLRPSGTQVPRVALASPWIPTLLQTSRLLSLGERWLSGVGLLLTHAEASGDRVALGARLLCLAHQPERARQRLIDWADARRREGQPGEAVEAVQAGLDLLGEDRGLRLMHGALLARNGSLDEARDELQSLLALEEDLSARVVLANLADSPLRERLALLDGIDGPASDSGPWLSEAWARARVPLLRARLLLDLGQLDLAEQALGRVASGPVAALLRGRLALLRGQSEQAHELLVPLLDNPSMETDARMLLATCLVRLGAPLDALRTARRALRQALAQADDRRITVAETVLLDVLIAAGRLTWARLLSLPLLVRARNGRDDALLGITLVLRARLHRRLGEPKAALTSVRQALPLLDRVGSWWRWEGRVQELWLMAQTAPVPPTVRGEALVTRARELGLARLELRARVVTAWLHQQQGGPAETTLGELDPGDLESLVDPDLMTAALSVLSTP